jgi:hypothetical protein
MTEKNKVNYTSNKGQIPLNYPIMEEDIKITEEELQAVYIYLSMTYSSMSQEEKDAWYSILSKIDKDFYED